jgi:hypothetical protein
MLPSSAAKKRAGKPLTSPRANSSNTPKARPTIPSKHHNVKSGNNKQQQYTTKQQSSEHTPSSSSNEDSTDYHYEEQQQQQSTTTDESNQGPILQLQYEQEKMIYKTSSKMGRMEHGLTEKQKEELQAILDESNIDIDSHNAHIRELFQEQLSICKNNISKYVRENFLNKYILELEDTRMQLAHTQSDYDEAKKRIRELQDDLSRALKKIERLKNLDQVATRDAEKLRVKVKEVYEEQFDIRAENKRFRIERNTLALENKKLRREKEALARELDITLFRMAKMITMNDKSLTPKQREEKLQQAHQKYIKKLTSGVGETPPPPASQGSPNKNTAALKNKTEREKELALDLEIFVSRVEQLKPVVNVLRDGSLEFKKYLYEFLDHVIELLLREKCNPFVNSTVPTSNDNRNNISSLSSDSTGAAPPDTSLVRYINNDELEFNIRHIMWALLDDPDFDDNELTVVVNNTDSSISSTSSKKSKSDKKNKKSKSHRKNKKLLLERKRALIEKLRELEKYKCSVDEMRKYIDRRVTKNDEWWTMLEKDLKDLLTQPSIGRYSGDSPSKNNTPSRVVINTMLNSPSGTNPEVHYNDLFGTEDTGRVDYQSSPTGSRHNHQHHHHHHHHNNNSEYSDDNDESLDNEDYCHPDMDDNLDVQHHKLHLYANYANNISSVLDYQGKKNRTTPLTSRPNVTNNTNFFYDMNVTTPSGTPKKATPQSSALSIFQKDKRHELFKKQNNLNKSSSSLAGSLSPRSSNTRSPLQEYTRSHLPGRGAFSIGSVSPSSVSPHKSYSYNEI